MNFGCIKDQSVWGHRVTRGKDSVLHVRVKDLVSSDIAANLGDTLPISAGVIRVTVVFGLLLPPVFFVLSCKQ